MSEETLHTVLLVCTGAVVFGVVFEGYEYWEAWKKGERTPLLPKIGFLILVLGLAGELVVQPFLNAAEEHARRASAEKIAALNLDAEKAKRETLEFANLMAVTNLWTGSKEDQDWLRKEGVELDSFPGLPLFIQAVPDFRMQLLAHNLARLFQDEHHWDVHVVDTPTTNLEPLHIPPGITLHIWRGGRWTLEPSDPNFETNPAWVAAQSLSSYLSRFLGLMAPHIMTPSSSDELMCPSNGIIPFALPENGIFLTIGLLDSDALFRLMRIESDVMQHAAAHHDSN